MKMQPLLKLAWIPIAILMLVTLAVGSASADDSLPVSDGGVVPHYVAGNPSCEDLGYGYGLKFDDLTGGTFPLGNGQITWSNDGTYVDWSSTIGVDAVIVKGGPNANSYVYDPPAESFGDSGLASPINPSTGDPFGLSHVEFCYDYEVEVTKTAETTFTRSYDWTIEKVGDQTELILSVGQAGLVNYEVTVDATYDDSDWAVSGTITIVNPDPNNTAVITGVTDEISGVGPVSVDCGQAFPINIAPGDDLVCSYESALPDGTQRVNTATVSTSGPVGGGSDTADVIFGSPTSEVDECIDVEDDQYGSLGTVCYDDLPKTFEYTLTVGPYAECGNYEFTNIASFITNDTETPGSDSWTVDVNVPCAGCTLTPGYWKTHSEYGPAAHPDDTWDLLPDGPDTVFYLSGNSYYEVLWTSPSGNPYYILAHAYIAAYLNELDGVTPPPDVAAAMTFAENFFSGTAPDVKLSKAVRAEVIANATILDNFNNGLLGPGHCSE